VLVFAKVILLFWGGWFVVVLSQLSTKFATRFERILVGSLEHIWNMRGTSLEQFILIVKELQGFVERAWNMRGTCVELGDGFGGGLGWIWAKKTPSRDGALVGLCFFVFHFSLTASF
jgi:hypothetical protein